MEINNEPPEWYRWSRIGMAKMSSLLLLPGTVVAGYCRRLQPHVAIRTQRLSSSYHEEGYHSIIDLPADCPQIVTLPASPPNFWIYIEPLVHVGFTECMFIILHYPEPMLTQMLDPLEWYSVWDSLALHEIWDENHSRNPAFRLPLL